jgi:hypothetical protein
LVAHILTFMLQKLIIHLKDVSKLIHLEKESDDDAAEGSRLLLGRAEKQFEGLEKGLAR